MSSEHQEEESLGKIYDRRLMRRLLRYLGPYKLTVAVSFVLGTTSRLRSNTYG